MSSETWIDASVPIRDGMVHWPGDPPIEVARVSDLERGDPATVSHLSAGVHSGTHVDAPVHFIPGGAGVDEIPIEALVGLARVVAIQDPRSVGEPELREHDPRAGERLLLRTRNSPRCWQTDRFLDDFVYLTVEGARFLAERSVRTVGIDYLSVGAMDAGVPTHRALLEAGVCIVEGLDLSAVEPGTYEMLCLPLRLAGGDGAPARVLLRPRSPG